MRCPAAAAAYENLVAGETAGDDEALAVLFTPRFLENVFRLTHPYDLRATMEGSPPLEAVSRKNVPTHADGRLSVEDTYIAAGHQLRRDKTFFVRQDGFLPVGEALALPVAPPPGIEVATLGVTLTDFAFELSQESVANAEWVVLDGTVAGRFCHEIVVRRAPGRGPTRAGRTGRRGRPRARSGPSSGRLRREPWPPPSWRAGAGQARSAPDPSTSFTAWRPSLAPSAAEGVRGQRSGAGVVNGRAGGEARWPARLGDGVAASQ